MFKLLVPIALGLLLPVPASSAGDAADSAAAGKPKPGKRVRAPAAPAGKSVRVLKMPDSAIGPSDKLITDPVKKAQFETGQFDIARRDVQVARDAIVVPRNQLPDPGWIRAEVVGADSPRSASQEGKSQAVIGPTTDQVFGPTDSHDPPVDPHSQLGPKPTNSPDSLDDVVAVGDAVRFHCTGIAIAPRAVLTARHCLPATRVLFGHDVAHPIAVRAVTGSEAVSGTGDIAVLWLATSLIVRQRRWHEAQDGDPALLGRIAGFGANDSAATRGAGEKRAARIQLQGWGCDISRARTLGCQVGHEIVVATTGGVDTCDGDSGGPLFERANGEWRLLGITSRPIASARKRCGDGGIYTRIDTVADWVLGVLRAGPRKAQP